ncbi:hypothetical protein L7F22_035108 [Adiantum nelumboides]|nr:hypothetical protein [Adiantum nelumboides]
MVPLAEQIEKYYRGLLKGIKKYCTKTSVMNMTQLTENAEVTDDLIQGKPDEDGFKTRRKEPQLIPRSHDIDLESIVESKGTLLLPSSASVERARKPTRSDCKGHKKWITSLSWEPSHLETPSRRFASGSKDGDVRIWDTTMRKCTICLTGHTLAVTCVKWSGEGLIYSSSQDCTIKVWETSQGKLIRELKGHGHWVNTLALSTEYVLRTGPYDYKTSQFSSASEMKGAALDRYNAAKKDAPERLVSGSDDFTMFLWEPSINKHPKARMTGHQQLVNHVYFSPDGRWIASASFDKSVKLWNGSTGEFIATFRGHVGPVYQISWSADSRLLLSGSKDSTLKIWDMRTRKLREDLPGHADEVFSVDWSPDGQKVASGGRDRVLKLWMG